MGADHILGVQIRRGRYNIPLVRCIVLCFCIVEADKHIDVLHYLKEIGDVNALIELGQTLGLGRAPLTLRESSSQTLTGYLIDGWIRRDYNVLERTGEPTWRSLAKALVDIGMNGISRDIQKDHQFSL